MTAGKRQIVRLPREQRIADIMRAARQVFVEKGYADASIAEIAERAGVVEGSIYRYFENKRDLLIKVVEHWYEGMIADYGRQLAGVRGTRSRLHFMIWNHLHAIHEQPGLCRLVFRELRRGREYTTSSMLELNRRYTQRTMEILSAGIDGGEFRPGLSAALVRDMIYGCIEHHTWHYLRGQGDFDVDATAERISDLVLGGIAGNAQSPVERPAARLERVAARLEAAAR